MKKTIATIALTASSSAFALMPQPAEIKTICLNLYENADGATYAGSCDEAANNVIRGDKILANGCAEGQASLTAVKYSQDFDINIRACLPPNVAQL